MASLFDRVREMRIECDARPGQIDAEGAAQRDLSATARALARYMLAANTIEYLPRDSRRRAATSAARHGARPYQG